ncbi:ankyrin repeat domain-containing protein 26-like [Sitophilus oryzae]|uniref:Ankyrin repeat domain-containing protein 26-like n=1 Tax=Sitophilus oryzae TaxID=7048 RepID=A0A6J2X281_SITOR|nr:ankyrin repeat domain-containing protein 26-like [Sitophilus oryzae]
MEENEGNSICQAIAEESLGLYCKDFTSIITKKINEYHTSTNVTDELELTHLKMVNKDVDKQIKVMQKKLEESKKQKQNVSNELFQCGQLNTRKAAAFCKTSEIIKVTQEEYKRIQEEVGAVCKVLNIIEKKMLNVSECKQIEMTQKNNIQGIEKKCKSISNVSNQLTDNILIKENQGLLKEIKLKEETLNEMKLRDSKQNQLKKTKNALLADTYDIKGKLEENRNKCKEIINQMAEKRENKQKKLEEILKETKRIEEHFKTSSQLREINEEKIIQLEKITSENRKEIEELNEKIDTKKSEIGKNTENYSKEIENQQNILSTIDKNIDNIITKHDDSYKILQTKSEDLKIIRLEKETLLSSLYNKKIEFNKLQFSCSQDQSKINARNEKLLEDKQGVVEYIKTIEKLDKDLYELNVTWEKLPKEFEEEKQLKLNIHKKEIKVYTDQQSYLEASIEVMQAGIENNTNKSDDLKKNIKDCEADIKWDQIRLAEQQKSLNAVNKNIQTLEEELKKEEEKENVSEIHFEIPKEVAPKNDTENNIVFNELIEDENKEVAGNSSGRKSPGILKTSSRSPRSPQTPNKRVKFEGLSSTDSSVISAQENANNVDRKNLDDLVLDNLRASGEIAKNRNKKQ